MFSQKTVASGVYGKAFEGSWRSFLVCVGKHRIVNFGRVKTEKAGLLRSLVGGRGFIAIRMNGREVIRKFNPERKGSYQFMIPEFAGYLCEPEIR